MSVPVSEQAFLQAYRLAPLEPRPGWAASAYATQPDDPVPRIRRMWFDRLERPVAVPWWGDTRLLLWPGEQLSAAIAQTGAFELSTAVALSRLLKLGDTFIDAGANSGAFTVPAARWVGESGRVVAIEPSPRELAKLKANIALNGLTNVTVAEAALGAAPGRAGLLITPDAFAGMNTLAPRFGNFDGEHKEQVEVSVVTLDSLCRDLPRVDVVKVDVEGAEVDLLTGATETIRAHRPAFVIEAAPTVLAAYGSSIEALEAAIHLIGYRSYAIDDATAALVPLADLSACNGDNIVALPVERPSAASL